MKKHFKLLIGLLVLIPFLHSCEDAYINCIKGNYDVAEELRDVNDFDIIEVDGSFDVYVSIGSVTEVLLEAEDNLLPYIETNVHGDKLEIDTRRNRCVRNHEPMKVYITVPSLRKVELNGSGLIECDGVNAHEFEIDLDGSGDIMVELEADFLDVDISGSGNVELDGEADEVDYRISGSGKIEGLNMEVYEAFSTISGSGDIYVHAIDFLDVRITGSGDVYYLGNPLVQTSITGSGSVYSW